MLKKLGLGGAMLLVLCGVSFDGLVIAESAAAQNSNSSTTAQNANANTGANVNKKARRGRRGSPGRRGRRGRRGR